VIVNNQGGQVNLASEGGQQSNVVKKEKKKRVKARSANKAGAQRVQAVK
jgi:hypothetical protein